ncbi:MAG TPA: hypothetical protein VK210_05855, partial [Terriglobia bacterium]|nr:hypothetical protein [Terriglobia bacterium]
TSRSGGIRVVATGVVGNLFRASAPSDQEYTVTVLNVAEGYAVQSITDSSNSDLLHGGRMIVPSDSARVPSVTITLTKN